MPDWPTETITDQDPRYRELLVQKADARARFLVSEKARAEIAAAAAGRQEKSSWKRAVPQPPSGNAKAILWTRSR